MSEPRQDAWNRRVEPRDHTWDERPRGEVVFCELCGVCHPADPDIEAVTGMWICQPCVEGMLDASTNDTRCAVGMVGGGH